MAVQAESDATLFSNMKSIMSLVDRLRDFKLDNYISLPRITVLGEQSAGKSSILEAVVGMNFLPRGSGVVTRRPLELRLKKVNVPVPYFIFARDFPNKKITSQEEVCKTIEQLTDKVAGTEKFISAEPIVLEVYSPTVPDLSLVDLPGITRIPIGKQPANIEEITKGLIRQYCDSPDSLILCVIPANIDITTSDALLFARQLDPSGSRTLGVLTKIDLMDEGVDCVKVLTNQEVQLTHGFVGIKGRNQREVNERKTVKDAIQAELNYFYRHPVYSTLPSELLGTSSLIGRVSKILYEMVQTALPRIQREILERKKKAKDAMDNLGENFPDSDEKKMELVFKLVRNFKESFDQDIAGKYFFEGTSSLKSKVQRKRGETVTYQLNQLFADLYQDYMGKDFRVTAEYSDAYIQNAMDTYQGDSMPGFQSFDSFLFLITPKLGMLKSPIYQVLEEAKNILETKGSELLDDLLKKYPKLLGEVKDTFLKVLNATKIKTQKILDNIVRCEENYLFTNNPQMLEGAVIKNKNMKTTAVNLMVTELRFRIDAYFNITVRNIRNTVPKIVGVFLLKKLRDNLEVEILNALSKKNYCIDGFAESDATADLRKRTRAELAALTSAENLLINEFGMTFNVTSDLGAERPGIKRRDTQQIAAEMMEDIDRLNEDFLVFNAGLLKLGGQPSKPNFVPKERPADAQSDYAFSKPLSTTSTSVNGAMSTQQTQKQPAPAPVVKPNMPPAPTTPPENTYKPNISSQPPPPANQNQTMQNQNPAQAPARNPNPPQQQYANPQSGWPNNNNPPQQPPYTNPQAQPKPNNNLNSPYDVNLFSGPTNPPRPNNPPPNNNNNAFLNFNSNRDKSPMTAKPNTGGPQTQPQGNPPPNPARPPAPANQYVNAPTDNKQPPKGNAKFGNLFG